MQNMLTGKLKQLFQSESSMGTFSRASITVATPDGMLESFNYGMNGSYPITEKTQFDIASVTKTVPVSTLALLAVDKSIVSLNTPVVDILPNLALISKTVPLLQHLLTQTLDFGFSLAGLKDLPASDLLNAILNAKLKAEPGEKFYYCNATSIILGMAIEKLYGEPLDLLASKFVFAPLDMGNSSFRPVDSLRLNIVSTEICPWRGREIQGEIHDESAWKLNQIMIPGAAGLFSTSEDLGRYLQMVLQGGEPLFSHGFIDTCAKNHIPAIQNAETGLGFEYNQPYMGEMRSQKTIGKTGFTGSVIVADIERKCGFSLLTDYTWPQRKIDKVGIMRLRSLCSDLVWQEFS